jgi:hypothetical protein
MKRLFTIIATCLFAAATYAQKEHRPFRAYLFNKEYEIFMQINFYEQNINIPGQELYGPLPGYLGKERNSFCWVITSAKLKNDRTAELAFINDYGSEDFTARLTQLNDSTYELRHLDGSALKVPKNGKWQKIPNLIELKRK